MRSSRVVGAVALLAVAGAAGCGGGQGGGGGGAAPGHRAEAVNPQGKPVKITTPGVPKGEQVVHLKVIVAPDHETVALVPVYIDGHGPLPFALDTGATQSLVDSRVATKLHLKREGSLGRLEGIAGSGRAQAVNVTAWRAGSIHLPPERLAAFKLAGQGPVGLLGSDVLSRYGKVAVDYSRDLLLLDPPVK